MRISTTGKHIRKIRITLLNLENRQYFHIIDQFKFLRAYTCVFIGHWRSCEEGHMKLRLQSLSELQELFSV